MPLALETDDKDEVMQALMAGMKAFNGAAVPNLNSHKIVAAIRDDSGKVVGGVIGRLAGDSVYMEVVYTDDSVRGTGLGREMMLLAETEAKRLGAREAWLYTMSFQAKPFYERLGYACFGEVPVANGTHKRYFLQKAL